MSSLPKFEVGKYLGDFSLMKNILIITINLKGYMILLFYDFYFF